jgi:hypothetical protein
VRSSPIQPVLFREGSAEIQASSALGKRRTWPIDEKTVMKDVSGGEIRECLRLGTRAAQRKEVDKASGVNLEITSIDGNRWMPEETSGGIQAARDSGMKSTVRRDTGRVTDPHRQTREQQIMENTATGRIRTRVPMKGTVDSRAISILTVKAGHGALEQQAREQDGDLATLAVIAWAA